MARSRPRKRFMFWIYEDVPQQAEVIGMVEDFKQTPGFSFAKAVREGIRLVWSLTQGDIQPLLTLFPFVEDAIIQNARERGKLPHSGDSGGGVTQAERLSVALEAQNKLFEQFIIQSGATPATVTASAKSNTLNLPTPEADDVELVVKRASGGNSQQNFFNSMLAMQRAKLPDDAPRKMQKRKSSWKKPTHDAMLPSSGGIAQIAGANKSFDAPSYDDIELTL